MKLVQNTAQKVTKTIVMHKKGDLRKISNYRPVVIASTQNFQKET